MVNFMGTLQNEWAGAQAFSSVDTYLAPFIRLDNLTYKEVKQQIQELIYNLNVPSRWGTQTPFTNFTFDWVCPKDLSTQHPKICGEEVEFTYGDLQKEKTTQSGGLFAVRGEITGHPGSARFVCNHDGYAVIGHDEFVLHIRFFGDRRL